MLKLLKVVIGFMWVFFFGNCLETVCKWIRESWKFSWKFAGNLLEIRTTLA